MRRTLAVKMVILAPLAVVLLTLFMASQAPWSTLRKGNTAVDAWQMLSRLNFQFWVLLMLPLYVALQTALIAGLDHSDNQWKALFARPVPRWAVYLAKLVLVTAMVAASATVLVICVVAEGKFLHWFDAGLGLGSAVPVTMMFRKAAQITALSFLFLSIQHWVGLQWRSFSVGIGFGIAATVTGFAMLMSAGPYGAWPQYFPWSLPMLAIARRAPDLTATLWISGIAGLLTSVAGCIHFCKREVS